MLHLRCDENNPCSPSLPVIGAHDHDHENVNLRAATLHVIGDIIQSLSILIGAIVIYFRVNKTRHFNCVFFFFETNNEEVLVSDYVTVTYSFRIDQIDHAQVHGSIVNLLCSMVTG